MVKMPNISTVMIYNMWLYLVQVHPECQIIAFKEIIASIYLAYSYYYLFFVYF